MPSRRSHLARPEVPDPAVQPTMTVREVTRVLGVSKSCAYEAVSRGQLPVIAIGRRRLVPTAKLREMLGLDGAHSGNAAAVLPRRYLSRE
jgi:excisionase family DNA binding protein